MKKRLITFGIIFCFLAAFPLVAAAGSKWTGKRFGGELNFPIPVGIPTADTPATVAEVSQYIGLHINETLVAMSEDFKVKPLLAESWTVSEDKTTYTFALRKGVKFHNGEVMKAADVVASYERFIIVSPRGKSFGNVISCEATDDHTVVFKLKEPSRIFLTNLAYIYADLAIQPKSVIEGKAANELKIPEEIIGTGPYKLGSYNPDTLVVLERFEGYQPLPGERNGMVGGKIPYFDRINLIVVPETASRIAGLETGDYDAALGIDAVSYLSFKDFPDTKAISVYPGVTSVAMFNHANKFSSDVKFRQAVLAAMNMEEIAMFAKEGQRDFFQLTPGLWPPEGAMYLPNDPVAKAHYNQNNIEKAKRLLKESGYNGEQLTMVATKQYDHMYAAAVSITDQLKKKLGMNIKIDIVDWPGLLAKYKEKEGWHISTCGYGSYLIFPWVLSMWESSSTSVIRAHYKSPRADAVFANIPTAASLEEEQALWLEFQQIFWQDVINMKLYDMPVLQAVRANVKNYKGWYRPRFFSVWKE